MTPKNLVEKILARATGRAAVSPGEYLKVRSRCPTVLAHHSVMNKVEVWSRSWGAVCSTRPESGSWTGTSVPLRRTTRVRCG